MENEKMIAFMRIMKDAFWYAEKAYKCSFNDPETNRKEDKCSSLAYAASCTAKYSAAEAIYWVSPELEQSGIPELFAQFSIFVNELQKNYAMNHMQASSVSKFKCLKKSFDDFICNQET